MIRILFFLLIISITINCSYAQEQSPISDAASKTTEKNDSLPYLKYPTLPAFNILLLDSVNYFNTYNIPKGKPSVLLFFDPDCKHCKATIKEIVQKMDSLSNIQFCFFSARHDLNMIRNFATDYHLNDFKNILAIGMDSEFFFFSYYKVKFVPDIVLYNENKKLIKLFDGSVSVRELYELTHK